MSGSSRIEAWSIAITRRIAFLAVAGMLCLAAFTVADVLLRWIANAPIFGFREVAQFLFAVTIAATFPAGLAERRNISIEVLKSALGPAAVKAFQAFGGLFLLLFFVLMAWRFAAHAQEMADRGEITLLLEMPVAPFWWSIAGFLALCVPAQLAASLVDIRSAVTTTREGSRGSPVWTQAWTRALTGSAVLGCLALGLWPFLGGVSLVEWLPGDRTTLAIVVFLAMCVLAVALVPLPAAMGLAGLAGVAAVAGAGPALHALANENAYLIANLNLAVIPLFLMMGSFAAHAGLASDVYRLAHAMLRHRPGGLAMATVGGCAGFGSVTGSSIATVATIGRAAFPEMRSRGYADQLSTGVIAAGGTLGTLVPPSGTMVLYAILTEVSVGQLFIAALVPATLAVLFYFTAIYVQVRLRPQIAPRSDPARWSEIGDALLRCWAVVLLFGVVIGGLYVGVFTATEAAAIGAGGGFLVALLRGRLGGGAFWRVMGETAATSAMIYLLILGGGTFSFFIGLTQLPETMTQFFRGLDVAPIVVIAGLLAIFVVLGTVIDPHGILVITVPIVAPLVAGLGYDLVWWGILMVVVVEIGVVTPPVGINVFVMKGVAPDVPLSTVFRGILPFVSADIFRLALLTAFPALVLWLPRTMH